VNTTVPGAGMVVSVAEDVTAFVSTVLMVFFPLLFLGLLVLAVAMTARLMPKIVRAMSAMLRVLRGRRSPT